MPRSVTVGAMHEITLFQPPTRPWGTPNMSPFCAKLECYLRMTEIPHKLVAAKFTKAPKGKIPFVLGDAPHTVDCTLFAFLGSTLGFPIDTALKATIRSHANLVAYHDRIRARWWSDLAA